jgi:tRNA pseudouridine38-40 synthase
MRYAVKIAYDGSMFHGSQRQGDDDRLSVEGAVGNALRDMRLATPGSWPVEFASRTDAGVSALGNVMALSTERDIGSVMSALNGNLDGIWCHSSGRMREHQNIRWAESRWYRYHLRPGELSANEAPAMKEALSLFVGEHDFVHFCRKEDGKDTTTIIERTDVHDISGSGDMYVVDIVGAHFMWQQVRRMVGASLACSSGEFGKEVIADLLKGSDATPTSLGSKNRVLTMPPTGLVLMDVRFKDIEFALEPRALTLALERGSPQAWEASMKVFLHSALRSMSPFKGKVE